MRTSPISGYDDWNCHYVLTKASNCMLFMQRYKCCKYFTDIEINMENNSFYFSEDRHFFISIAKCEYNGTKSMSKCFSVRKSKKNIYLQCFALVNATQLLTYTECMKKLATYGNDFYL